MPILVLLVVLLTAFAFLGYTLNGVVRGVFGFYPPVLVSATVAFLGALPVVRMTGAIARLIPRDETTAVSFESLVGRVAVVVSGTARAGYPARRG